MLERQHQLSLDDRSMIGWCIQHRVPRIALDVGEDAVHFNNPDLPDTHSELALPLVSRGQVLGAMTVQSTEVAAFTEQDIAILQTMSDQVATQLRMLSCLSRLVRRASKRKHACVRRCSCKASARQSPHRWSSPRCWIWSWVPCRTRWALHTTHCIWWIDRLAWFPCCAHRAQRLGEGLTRSIEQLQNDILLDILNKGQIDVIDGWDDRFDREIYEARAMPHWCAPLCHCACAANRSGC